jgi:hypothetical protein
MIYSDITEHGNSSSPCIIVPIPDKTIKFHCPFCYLSDMQIVFAKHIMCDKNASEETFLQTSFTQLQALGIQPKKMMAGLKRKGSKSQIHGFVPSHCHQPH